MSAFAKDFVASLWGSTESMVTSIMDRFAVIKIRVRFARFVVMTSGMEVSLQLLEISGRKKESLALCVIQIHAI